MKLRLATLAALCLAAACTDNTPSEPKPPLAAGPDTPQFVRASWTADPSATAAVVWWTETKVKGTAVEYGASKSYGKVAAGEDFDINGFDGNFHRAELTGLAPGSAVHYRVGGKTGVSGDFTLTTAPAAGADAAFSFVIEGDSRADGMPGVGAGYPELIKQIAKEAPLFILDSGDYTFLSQPSEWMDWMKAGDAIGATVPRLTTFGNHEMVEKNYFGLMELPGDNEEKWYALDYGPLHIVCLYTGFGSIDSGTAAWLAKDLAASKAKWKIAYFHMPPYNAGNHGDEDIRTEVRDAWVPLFEKYKVDVVVGGHDHNYQNFGFLKGGVPVGGRTPPLKGDGSAPLYLVSGGAGAPLYPTDPAMPDYPLLVSSEKTENYVLATLDGGTLTLEVKRLDGTIIETTTITK
jgi:hypothetical protein